MTDDELDPEDLPDIDGHTLYSGYSLSGVVSRVLALALSVLIVAWPLIMVRFLGVDSVDVVLLWLGVIAWLVFMNFSTGE